MFQDHFLPLATFENITDPMYIYFKIVSTYICINICIITLNINLNEWDKNKQYFSLFNESYVQNSFWESHWYRLYIPTQWCRVHPSVSWFLLVDSSKLFGSFSSSVQSLSSVWLFVTPWTAALQGSLSFVNSQSLLKLMSIEVVMMPSNHFILCCPLLFLPSIFSSIRVFSNELALHIRWPIQS